MDLIGLLFSSAFGVVFMSGFGFVLYNLIKHITEEESNSRAPQEQRKAVIVAKRMEVYGGEHTSTDYFVTFELENNERVEMKVAGAHYGKLAEGDIGLLTRKGTKFIGFARKDDKFSATPESEKAHKCRGCGAVFTGEVCDYCGTPWKS